jgi:hypothetical protein
MKEGETPQEAYARAQRQFPNSFKRAEPEKKEVTVGGQTKEFFKGLAPGAINLVESAAIGASSLLKDDTEKAARSGIASLASAAKKPFAAEAGYEDTVGRKFGEAAGSIIPFLALGPLGAAGRVGMGALGSGAGAGEARTRAETGEATSDQRAGATALGAVVGISEMFAPARILGRISEPVKDGAVSYVKRALMAGGEEAAQEAASQAAQNLISKGIYKPDQEIIEGVGESAAYGGAVGGLAQGLLDLALGRRAKGAGKPQQEEFAKLRAEEEQRLEAERQRKTTPEYAQEVVQQYDVLAKQKQDLIAQIKKIEKTSPTADADRAFNTQINAQIKELSKEIEPLAEDYYKAKAQVDAIAKQEALDKVPPQDFMLEQLGMEVKPVKAKKEAEPEIRRGKGQLFGDEIAPPPAPDTSVQQYAQGQFDAARGAGVFDLGDIADYMMQDPAKAAEMVKTRTKMSELTASDNAMLLSGVKLRLAGAEKAERAATKQELAQRQETLKSQTLTQPEDQMAMFKESQADVEEQAKNAEPNFDYLDPMFEKALEGQTVIAVDPSVKPIARGPQVRERIDALIAEADKADQDYRTARYAMPAQGKRGAPERAAAMEALTKGKTALEKIEQISKEGGAYAREVIAARRAQQEAMAKLSDITEQLRTEQTLGGANKEMAASTEQSLSNKAEQVRGQLISSALQEAALNRRAAGQPAITQDEAIKAASVMFDAVNDWVTRSNAKPTQAEFEDVIVQPAQMRADKIIRPAVTERRQVKAGTQAISKAEITHFQERIKSAMRNLLEKPDVKATRVETGPLKRQFKETEAQKVAEARGETATTLSGELRRRTEFVRNKMAKMGGMRPGARDALNAAADLMDNNQATREILDKVEPVVDAIVAGRDVKQVDIQAINDAIRATETVPQGQKALFPEIQEELGYLRATPKNFANSPQIKPVWAAIDKAKALFQKTEPVRLAKEATRRNRIKLLNQLEGRMDSIRNDTQFFWKDTSRWTDAELAKVFVGMPEAGTTQADKDILYKYVKGQQLTPQEKVIAAKLIREFQTQELPKYQEKIKEAMSLLAQGRRLTDVDNQLLSFMQDTNANVKATAKALSERMAGMRKTVEYLKEVMRGSVMLTPEQKALLDSESAVEKQRGEYQMAVEQAITKANKEMETARAALLDPQIGAVSKELKAAKKTLAKEKPLLEAEIVRLKSHYDAVMILHKGAMRNRLASAKMSEMEEKKTILNDLTTQVKEQEEALDKLVTERHEEFDGATVVIQAMLDGKVKMERQYLEMQEATLASMRGETVLDNPNAYPFAYRQAQKNLDSQKPIVQAAEKRATAFKEVVKTEQQKMEAYWKDQLGGEGIKREEGKVEPIQTTAEKEAEQLRVKAMEALDKEEDAFIRTARKEAAFNTYVDEVTGLMLEAENIPGPDDLSELKKIINDETQSDNTRIMAMAKVGVLQAMESAEAQYEVDQEGKPRRKQRAATTLSSVGQAKGKPLRTGNVPASQSIKTLLSPEKKRERVKDTLDLGAFVSSDDVRGIFGGGRTSVDFNEARTLFDLDFDAMSMGPTFTYKGTPVAELADVAERSVLGDLYNMYMRTASNDPKAKFDAAKSRILVGLKSDAGLYKNSNPTLSARIQKRVDFLEGVTVDDVVITVPGGGFRGEKQTATLAPAKLKAEEPLKVSDSMANSKFNQLGVKLATDIGYNGLSFAQAAEYGAKRAKNANQKILFERMQEIFADAKPDKYSGRVFASSTAMNSITGSAAGYYIPSLDMVIVSEAKLDPMQTLLHELVHAASVKMLSQDKALDNRVTVLRERVEQWSFTPEGEAWLENNFRQTTFDGMPYFPDLYGLTNNKEFLAETFANPEFQKMLAEIPSDMPRKSLLTRLVEFLSRSFSMPAKAMQSLFAESMVLTEEIMQRTKTEIYEAGVDPRSDSLPAPLIAYDNPEFNNVRATMKKVVAQDKTWWDSIKANTSGLAFETQLVDRFAGFERLAKYMEPLKGTQMLYYLRSYDQRMNIVSKAVSDGAPAIREITRDDGRVERLVETTGGASIAGVVNKLKEANQYIGNGDAVNQVFTTYMAAIRAKNKGIETLNFGTDENGKPVLTQEMLDEVTNLVNKNAPLKKIFGEAREEYNKYNRDLLDFVASTGALSKALVKKLVAEDDYIPFYRERKGVVELVIGNESPIRIGSIAEQPYLDKLVGGDTAIIDFMTSSVQNTNMLVDMGMRNLATKNAVMELVDLKAATLVKKADGSDVVKFKVDGDDRYAIIATEKVMIGNKEFETGVPADLLVKGMEGIPTQMPFLFRVMAMPAQLLRKAITLSPLYMAKQLFRDSLAAPILSGADFVPVLGVLSELNGTAKEKLEKRGIVGGQYFRGTSEDLSMILREISDGQPGWMKALGRFEAMGMEADALTRRAQYNSYIEQGLSEMEATLMALESMNFNKRGASPSVHVANALIPFFNAQIQGLNVMYKAMSGDMPFNDQLRIREKMLMRGGMMAAATFAYAAMMEDDEAYKNATPDQKYGNWFVRLPGLDEPVKVPVPFEIGYIFKAIPEALYNSMTTEHGGEEAVKAFKQILLQTVPGGSSYGIPQAAKPLIEVGLGKSFYTGRDILSAREKQLLPEEQYRVNTSEAAKLVGSTLGVSPIKIEALVSGYTGTMGLAFLQAISLGVPSKETPERAVRRLSEYPILGGAFQPNDAGGIINSVYERMNEISQVKFTVNKLLEEGKVQEAEALITKRGTEYMQSELANTFKTNMNMLTQAERAIAASKMTPEAKREQLDNIRKMKIALANTTREISDKTIRLVGGS